MELNPNLLTLRKDLLARLDELVRKQPTISAQDLRTGNFVPAFAASLLPHLERAGLLERKVGGGMHGGATYAVTHAITSSTWGRVKVAMAEYLTTLGGRGFEYQLPGPVASPGPYAKRVPRAAAET